MRGTAHPTGAGGRALEANECKDIKTKGTGRNQAAPENYNDPPTGGLIEPELGPRVKLVDPDAAIRSVLARRLITYIGLYFLLVPVLLLVAAIAEVPTDAISTFLQWAASGLLSLVTLVIGYYFGSQARGPGQQRQ